MGSWAATCAISRLAINPGDEVFWIYPTEDYVNCTHDLLDSIAHQLRRMEMNEKTEESNKRLAERFPDLIDEVLLSTLPEILTREDYQWGFGEYDDYGGVEDIEIPDKFSDKLIFIRKSVADKMAKYGKTLMKREWAENPKLYEESYPYCVILFAWLTRCQIFGFQLLGRQYPDIDEFREIKKLQEIIYDETDSMYAEEIKKNWLNKWEDFLWDIEYKFKKLFKKGE